MTGSYTGMNGWQDRCRLSVLAGVVVVDLAMAQG